MPLSNVNIAKPPFTVQELPKTDHNEDRFRVLLINSSTHYYIAINSTVLAVWRGKEQTPVIDVVKLLADHFNVLGVTHQCSVVIIVLPKKILAMRIRQI